MAEPDQPSSDPIGYRMADPCAKCGASAATRRDNGLCYFCNLAGFATGGQEPADEDMVTVQVSQEAAEAAVCAALVAKLEKRADVTAQHHYTATAIEPIEVIEAWNLDRYLTQVMKYIGRHEHKGSAEHDLYKALDWLHRRVYGEWLGKPPPPGVGGDGE